ncbi:MAG: hypothetical protein JWQ48_2096 [Conexibacter sp.]|nr:hypothetical protein [Conexibacter sp.]
MRIYVSVDMEGISGVESVHDIAPGLAGYPTFRRAMAQDANAAIEGAFRGGAGHVLVADGHAMQTNILPADLDPRAQLKSGPAPLVQFKGLTADVDAVLLVGHHAKSGTPDGILSHSFLSSLLDVRLDGRSLGESELAAQLLAARGIPVVLLSGDDATLAQGRATLGEGVEYVEVKRARSRTSADHDPPAEVRERLRDAAERAVRAVAAGGVEPIAAPGDQVELEIDLALAPNDAMPDMLERNQRFADAADAPPLNDFDYLRSLEPFDSTRPGTIRVAGTIDDAYHAISRICAHLMARNIDWMLTEVAPSMPYARDLAPWQTGTAR